MTTSTPRRRDSAGRLVAYLIGACCLAVVDARVPPRLTVTVPTALPKSEREQREAADRAILLDQAHRLGWAESDPVVAGYLVRMLRATGEPGDDAQLLRRALALQLHHRDPVVQARLLDRARSGLAGQVPTAAPEQLQAFFAAHRARFEKAPTLRFSQLFATEETEAIARAAELRPRLQAGNVRPDQLYALGDPLLQLRAVETVGREPLRSRYGDAWLQAVEACAPETLCGPLASPFGWHLVWLYPRVDRPVTLEDVHSQVAAAWRQQQQQATAERRLQQLRQRYTVRWLAQP